MPGNSSFEPVFAGQINLTPHDRYVNLTFRRGSMIFEPEKRNFSTFRIVFKLVNAAGATLVIVAVVDSPEALPEENDD